MSFAGFSNDRHLASREPPWKPGSLIHDRTPRCLLYAGQRWVRWSMDSGGPLCQVSARRPRCARPTSKVRAYSRFALRQLNAQQRSGLAFAKSRRVRSLARLNRTLVAISVVTRTGRGGHTYPDLRLCECPKGDLNPQSHH